jgi:hypothetical protein
MIRIGVKILQPPAMILQPPAMILQPAIAGFGQKYK